MGNIVTREKKDLFIEDPYVIEGPDGHASTGGPDDSPDSHEEKVPLLEERLLPYVFRWDGGGNEVYLSGTFNEWETDNIMMATNSQGEHTAVVELPEGSHEYKFVVDGQWFHKPDEPATPNCYGTYNNVVELQQKHLLAYYEMWDLLTDKGESIRDSGSFTDSYSQNLPPRSATPDSPPQIPRVSFKPMIQLDEEKDDPEMKDVPFMDEMPPSNSVVLSDLYALTTKDNILVLTATIRCQLFKEKCFTTLLYKSV